MIKLNGNSLNVRYVSFLYHFLNKCYKKLKVKNDQENKVKELENNLHNMVNTAGVKSKCSWYQD